MSMQISELDLKEFKGIKKMEKPMELSRFNVLIGRNNSGKSSILQALFLLPLANRKDSLYSQSVLQEYSSKGYLRPHGFVFLYSGEAELNFSIHNKNFKIKIDHLGNCTSLILEGDGEKYISNEGEISKKIGIKNLEEYSIYLPYDTSFFRDMTEYVRSHKAEITKKSLHTKVAKFINKSIDDRFTEVIWTDEGISLRRKDAKYIKIEDLGSGARKVITTMLALENINPKLVLWDDFDAGMHPSLIKTVLKWLNSHKDWQVVLSTHSIDVLYHILDLENTKDIRIHLLRKKYDILESRAIDVEELEDLIDANTDPRLLVDVMDV